jgi:3-hydroxyacyl-CoA dehydrogenase/enoyl-CoA hydratase/3-hydroxybutyryl-CoA epimerase
MKESQSSSSNERLLRRTSRPDGVCVLTFDRPNSSANIFDARTFTQLIEELEAIEADPQVRGVVLATAKKSIFVAGLDLSAVKPGTSAEAVRSIIELGQRAMHRLASMRAPTAAAIHGAALGGGFEVCIACDYRVASTERATRIGLPEVHLGLLPAWGGCVRLPRLIGTAKTVDLILAGKTFSASAAKEQGLVDELAPLDSLIDAAAKKVLGGKPNRPAPAMEPLTLTREKLLHKTRGHYPAPVKIFDVITLGAELPLPEALKQECDGIVELSQGAACHNLLRGFFLTEQAKKRAVPGVTLPADQKPIARVAVIGAGVMGSGIAQWLAARGLQVYLRDVNADVIAKGMAGIAKMFDDGVKRQSFSDVEAKAALARIQASPADAPLPDVDLVIEAATERVEIKRELFRQLDEQAPAHALLATNTSALSVSELATVTRRPANVVGLHFFNPVSRMQLIEVVSGKQTSLETLQRALKFAQQLGKLAVPVNDQPGFIVNRILIPYLAEAHALFAAGAAAADLEEAMLDFGMPMGPLRLIDEIGLDVVLLIQQTLAAGFPGRITVPPSLNAMLQTGAIGRKVGRGFYTYKGKDAEPNPECAKLVTGQSAAKLSRADLQARMVNMMVNEAALCLADGVVTDPADVDFAMVTGTGFAPFRGGPLRHADAVGAKQLVETMKRQSADGAPHLAPCARLVEMAASGKKFYGDR